MAVTARGAAVTDSYTQDNSVRFARWDKPAAENRHKFLQDAAAVNPNNPANSGKISFKDKVTDFLVDSSAKDAINDLVNTVTNPTKMKDITVPSPVPASPDEADDDLTTQFESLINNIYDINQSNNAMMVENAERQMRFQEQSQAKAMQFNAEQAKLDRDWQEYMSNTAHQREVGDLVAAGLNPVLSANGGAPVGSGASASTSAQSGSQADVDTSITNFLGNLAGAMASMHNAEVSAKAAMGSASITASAMRAAAKYGMFGNLGGSGIALISNIFGRLIR